MLCSSMAKSKKSDLVFPCGQCKACLINKRRNLLARILLEASCHEYSRFITLTIADPGGKQFVGPPHPLRKPVAQKFIKRLRARGFAFRYFLVGEYGTQNGRAHYHALLFSHQPIPDHDVSLAWGIGRVHFGDVEQESIDYCISYCLKSKGTTTWPIENQWPEFRLPSAGLGRGAFSELTRAGFLPREFRVFGKSFPIGRYFREKAKEKNIPISDTKENFHRRLEYEQMLRVYGSHARIPPDAWQQMKAMQEARSKALQKRAIRDKFKAALNLERKKRETL